jgi:hypothetical protein
MLKGQALDFHATFPIDECQRLLSVRTTAPLGGLTFDSPSLLGDDWRRVQRLRSEGILLQGRIWERWFDVYCLEDLAGLRGNRFRPHYIGRFEARPTGTAVVGKLGVATGAKVWPWAFSIPSLALLVLGVVAGAAPLAIFGGVFFALMCVLVPNFCLFMARDEWNELPATLRDVFQAS